MTVRAVAAAAGLVEAVDHPCVRIQLDQYHAAMAGEDAIECLHAYLPLIAHVQIADALRPEAFDEPLRSGITTKGESVLRKLLERGNVPTRIKITSAGITEVGIDRRQRPFMA